MKNICYINGSLRGSEASSLTFINDLDTRFHDAVNRDFINVKAGASAAYLEETFIKTAAADALIFVFPLFAYCLPGALMRFLEEYWEYIQLGHNYNKDAKIYVIVNCGFPVPTINKEAVRIIKNFCTRLNLKWRFAICIASGPLIVTTKKVPFLDIKLKRAFNRIVHDVLIGDSADIHDVYIRPIIPKSIVLIIKKRFENKIKLQKSNIS
jgi:hypothetical protein